LESVSNRLTATSRNGVQSGGGSGVEFDLLRRMGVVVQDVPGLCTPASYIAEINLVVVRSGMSHEAREHCAAWLLSEVIPARMQSPVE
jgi:hypothetical protein